MIAKLLSTLLLFSAINLMTTMSLMQSRLKTDDKTGIISTFLIFGGCAALLLLVREFCIKP